MFTMLRHSSSQRIISYSYSCRALAAAVRGSNNFLFTLSLTSRRQQQPSFYFGSSLRRRHHHHHHQLNNVVPPVVGSSDDGNKPLQQQQKQQCRPQLSSILATPRIHDNHISSSSSSSNNNSNSTRNNPRMLSHYRYFASSAKKDDSEDDIVLFERGPGQLMLMRTGFGFSCFQTAYWIWYTTEYIPIVNASPMEELYMDPSWGVAGILFSLTLQSIFMLYPKRLVSKIIYKPRRYLPQQQQEEPREIPPQLWIYTHHIPWIRPATVHPTAVIPILPSSSSSSSSSSSDNDKTLLNPASASAKEILQDLKGKIDEYQGMLVLKNPTGWIRALPLLMDFTRQSVVQHPQMLIQALLFPHQLVISANRRRRMREYGHHDEDDEDEDDYYFYRDDPDSHVAPTSRYRPRSSKRSRRIPMDSLLRKIARQRRR